MAELAVSYSLNSSSMQRGLRMTILRTDIERALDEIASQEEGMRFQGLAIVLGKKVWPELIARQRKKDFGLDAYAPASLTPDSIGKGLAASITPTLNKISGDAETAKKNFHDLGMLLFVTPAKVGNADRKRWEAAIQKDHGVELHIIEREEIITQMMMPENASLLASFLNIEINVEPQLAYVIEKTRRAAEAVTLTWAAKTKGHPLIDLTATRLDPNGAESADVMSLEQIDLALLQSSRIVIEGPAGRGKTTTLIQLATRPRTAGIPLIIELPAWTSLRQGILEYIAGMPAFQSERLTAADLARVQQTEPFLFLLNGWNEIADTNSSQANHALWELERDFPGAGIIVATRTYHLTPPLPGATRLRLMRLQPSQRGGYLAARLGAREAELCVRIDADPSLDELTRTPFILSEVASLFEVGAEIPSTKIGILDQVLRLHERRDEHRNALQAAPIFGMQENYLKAIATEMTRRGAVTLLEADARAVVATVVRELAQGGQIDLVGAPTILATLTAHHVLERVDYPQTAFRFEHQQLQEYYAALGVNMLLFDLRPEDQGATGSFMADYVNDPAWDEPLRMIAETFAEQTGDSEADRKNTHGGRRLVELALVVDPVFAAELAQLCGKAVWNEVRSSVGERLRSLYMIGVSSFKQYATTAMLATGADDFSDIIVPLLSEQDQQTRFVTYRLWSDIHLSSLGANWPELVRGLSEDVRADFVSELLHHRIDDEIVAFAAEDESVAVKTAAVLGLMWSGPDRALTRVLESMDEQTFEEVSRQNSDRMPTAVKPRTIVAMRKFIESTTDHPAKLRTALELANFGETDMDGVIKDALMALSSEDVRNLGPHYIQPMLEHLRKTNPAWVSEWVAVQIAEDVLYDYEYWLPFATVITDSLVEKYLQRVETVDLTNGRFGGITSIIAAGANENHAARVFARLREIRRKVDEDPGARIKRDGYVRRQLEAVFHHLPDDIAVAGILSSVKSLNPLDIKVAAGLLSRIARSNLETLSLTEDDLKVRLRAYLKDSVDLVLGQDDFSGEEKANLASSIAQVGNTEDIADLVRLVHADIQRVRRGRAANAAGDRGPLGNGGSMSYSSWHITAIMHLDASGAEQVLIDLLSEPEYSSEAAAAMARDFLPKSERSFNRAFRYDLMWAAREGHIPTVGDDKRRIRLAAALNAEIKRRRETNQDEKPAAELKDLAKALAAIDGRAYASVVLDVIAIPGQWGQYTCLDVAERLLMAGVVLPCTVVFALLDSVAERTEKWMQDSDKDLIRRILALCPFVDDPAAGVTKIRNLLAKRKLQSYELRELITALGESRSDMVVDLLYELASDSQIFGQCEEDFINAFAKLDTPRTRELLLGFVDPDIGGIVLTRDSYNQDLLVTRLADLAQRNPQAGMRLMSLCERDLAEFNRYILSRVMSRIGSPEALAVNMNLIDDANASPVPQGVWDQLENAFVERRPYEHNSNVFTQHARASNELRILLFRMAIKDEKRKKSAFRLLGQIEKWRLEYGRPTGEPRHPDLASGQSWPPVDI
ncbi:NACHT domain-containing protein [Pseudomonas grimontii]|uniref:NACHT domain-containing protein n=1 Tax=Pseudomonas grimontii TaxID=129847 RepID=UPI00387B6676